MNATNAKVSLFTATDLARLCQVDQKTIHNWVDRGAIPSIRTPGRHLRFKPNDVLNFLRKYGYTVPADLLKSIGRPLVVAVTHDPLDELRGMLGSEYELVVYTDIASAIASFRNAIPAAFIIDADDVAMVRPLLSDPELQVIRWVVYSTDIDAHSKAGVHAAIVAPNLPELHRTLQAVLGLQAAA